jgi:hypothetical protein
MQNSTKQILDSTEHRITRRSLLTAIGCSLVLSLSAFAAPEVELGKDHPKVKEAMGLQNGMTPDLIKVDGILGTATGIGEDGQVSIVVYVNKDHKLAPNIIAGMPKHAKNVPIRVELTEPFRALAGKPAGVSHTAKQTTPIKLGTSGGWRSDLANGYCCGGTLGSLIQVKKADNTTVQYILSNYHVFESDVVNGGNGIVATMGDPIIQPGLIDVGCNAANAQIVANLVKVSSLPDHNVDASVAQVANGMVDATGAILEIGTISSNIVSAAINQAVKKSGRTSGLTRSKVVGFNGNISVTYDNECAGGAAFTKTFTGQIIVSGGSKFLKGGDSGSLMVQDVATNPKAIGLLYAGNNLYAIANPINDVLAFLGAKLGGTATMVGN